MMAPASPSRRPLHLSASSGARAGCYVRRVEDAEVVARAASGSGGQVPGASDPMRHGSGNPPRRDRRTSACNPSGWRGEKLGWTG